MEVYGTKPKRFTKAWWEYFWDYYKWHTVAILIVLLILITAISECAHTINYDLQIDYISEHQLSNASLSALTALIEANTDDATENGKVEAYVTYLDMGEHIDLQYTQAMFTKYSVEIGYTESFVFLVSEKFAEQLSGMGIFEEAKNWCSAPSQDGYCVSLEGCESLENIGIDTTDLYVGVIKLRERDSEKERRKNLPKHENGIKFARFLVNER